MKAFIAFLFDGWRSALLDYCYHHTLWKEIRAFSLRKWQSQQFGFDDITLYPTTSLHKYTNSSSSGFHGLTYGQPRTSYSFQQKHTSSPCLGILLELVGSIILPHFEQTIALSYVDRVELRSGSGEVLDFGIVGLGRKPFCNLGGDYSGMAGLGQLVEDMCVCVCVCVFGEYPVLVCAMLCIDHMIVLFLFCFSLRMIR